MVDDDDARATPTVLVPRMGARPCRSQLVSTIVFFTFIALTVLGGAYAGIRYASPDAWDPPKAKAKTTAAATPTSKTTITSASFALPSEPPRPVVSFKTIAPPADEAPSATPRPSAAPRTRVRAAAAARSHRAATPRPADAAETLPAGNPYDATRNGSRDLPAYL